MYGLCQAGILANKVLKENLEKDGYFELPHTPGLWKHESDPIAFSLVVDNFEIKYTQKEDVKHLLVVIGKNYPMSANWSGELYCGITLECNYERGYVHISMPKYVQNNSPNTAIPTPNALKIALIPPPRSSMEKQRRKCQRLTHPPFWMKKGKGASSRSWGA